MDNITRGPRRTRHLAGRARNGSPTPATAQEPPPHPLLANDDDEEEDEDFDLPNEQDLEDDLDMPPDMQDDDIEDAYEDTTSREEGHDGEGEGEDYDEQENARGQTHPFDAAAAGLKEISNLGKFTVSSHKIGNGVEELRSDDLKQFWQSDGPQPHKLTIYFIKRVGIRDIRFYVDATEDESYTPTKIIFKSGTGENNLIEFASMDLNNPIGWQKVPVAGAGGGSDGNTLYSYVLQMQILENHQNGKDTHLRGIRIYAMDQEAGPDSSWPGNASASAPGHQPDRSVLPDELPAGQKELEELLDRLERDLANISWTQDGTSGFPDWMKEPDLR